MASKLTWEWRAPSGEVVSAVLELPSRVESVWLGPQLLSSSMPGGRAEGHPVPLASGAARVEFNAALRACALIVDGRIIPPVRVGTKSNATLVLILAAAAALVVLVAVMGALAVYGVRKYRDDAAKAEADAPLTQRYPSESGLLVAHYPADFAATPRSKASLQLSRSNHDDSILLIAVDTPVSEDPSELSRVALKPILDGFTKAGGTVRTLTEGTATCLGSEGYSTSGVASLTLETVDTWSCTFVHGGHGYVFFISVNQTFSGDMPFLRRIVDATELTGPEGTVPTPPPPGAANSAPPVAPGATRGAPKRKGH